MNRIAAPPRRGRATSAPLAGLITALAWLVACGDPIGTPCEFTGSGFQARDGCRGICLQVRPIVCADGAIVREDICSGATGCVAGECPSGQRCYRGTHDRSMCVPDTMCDAWAESGVHGPVLVSDEALEAARTKRLESLRPTRPAADARTGPDR